MSVPTAAPLYLHVGCGPERLDGWVNVDIQQLPSVDVVADVTQGLPFDGAAILFAEHFLEHLRLDHALAFLREAHRVLTPGGWLRLSTPNLDWVWSTHYDLDASRVDRGTAGLRLNRAFRGWGHQFLWNRQLLGEALHACGFVDLAWRKWGESGNERLRGLERHETWLETPELPHVLIVEARRGEPDPERWRDFRAQVEEHFLHYLRNPRHVVDAQRSRLVARTDVRGPLSPWIGAHLLRAGAVEGSIVWHPEAVEDSHATLRIPVGELRVDEPADRRAAGLPAIPERLRRRFRYALLAWQLQVAEQPAIGFRSSAVRRLGPGRYAVHGELSIRGTAQPVDLELTVETASAEVRLDGTLRLAAADFGLPPYRQGRGLLRGSGEVVIDIALIATASDPT